MFRCVHVVPWDRNSHTAYLKIYVYSILVHLSALVLLISMCPRATLQDINILGPQQVTVLYNTVAA
jgi:hypothetical protein